MRSIEKVMSKGQGPYISLQTKFAALILACTLFTTFIIGGVGLVSAVSILDKDSTRIIELTVSDAANYLNNALRNMAECVDEGSLYASTKLVNISSFEDAFYRESYLQEMRKVLNFLVDNDKWIYSYYFQLDPEICSKDNAFCYRKSVAGGTFTYVDPINISDYSMEDPRVSWYYLAKEQKAGVWTNVKYDPELDINKISYIEPLFKGGTFIGAIGMDIDFSDIIEYIDNIQPYEGSAAFLLSNKGTIVYHKFLEAGTNLGSINSDFTKISQQIRTENKNEKLITYEYRGEVRKLNWRSLNNNMKLVLTTPLKSILEERSRLTARIVAAALLISMLFFVLTMNMVFRIIKPIQKLRISASRIAEGDLEVDLRPESNDEIGDLTVSFSKNVMVLKSYVEQIKGIAYIDPLTGVKSKAAYEEYIKTVKDAIKNRKKALSIIVIDINNLKIINDAYGHAMGDKYIINCCGCFSGKFINSPMFRIGGDEFVVFLSESRDYSERYTILEYLENEMNYRAKADIPVEVKVSAAYGIADFDPDTSPEGMTYDQLFNMADENMYKKKKEMKAERA